MNQAYAEKTIEQKASDRFDKTILIVSEESDLREVTQIALELTTKWRVLGVRNCLQVALMAQNKHVDAILLCVKSTDTNFAPLLHQFKSHPATEEIPIVLMTDRVRFSDRCRFARLGFAGAISTPFDAINLWEQLAGFLEW